MSDIKKYPINHLTPLDQYDDNGLFLRKELGSKPVPYVIKTAADLSSTVTHNEEDYALVVETPMGREYRYPCVDAGNTLASAMYFSEYGGGLPQEEQVKVAQNLNNALLSFGFTPPEVLTKTASLELGYSDHADNMSLESLFGVGPSDQYEVIEDAFNGCSPRGKRRLLLQVKEASAHLELPQHMQDYASESLGSDLKMSLDLRKLVVMDPAASEQLDSLLEKSAGVDVDSLASALYEFDIEQGITHLYNNLIPDPYASVLGTSIEKTAQAGGDEVVEVGGREYSNSDLQAYAESSNNRLGEVFGEDFSQQFSEDPLNVFKSLPVTHRQAIAGMINDAN